MLKSAFPNVEDKDKRPVASAFYRVNAAPPDSKHGLERASGRNQRETRPGGHLWRKCLKLRSLEEGRDKRLSPEIMITEKSAFDREGRVAVSGHYNSPCSTDPRRNHPRRPENQAFTVIHGDRHWVSVLLDRQT